MNKKEILKKIGKGYKSLADKTQLNINNINGDRTELSVIFSIQAETIADNISQIDSDSLSIYYRLLAEHLLSLIEKNLYEVLPTFNIEPVASLTKTNTKILIDSHIPDGVVLMSPKTYAISLSSSEGFPFQIRQYQ